MEEIKIDQNRFDEIMSENHNSEESNPKEEGNSKKGTGESRLGESKPENNTKKILMFVGIIVIAFLLTFIVRFFYDDKVYTIDELHQKNLEGEESDVNYVYNGYSFVFYDNLWYTQVSREKDGALLDIPLHYGPRDLSDVSVIGGINWELEDSEVYLTFNPTEESHKYVALSAAELSLNLVKGMEVIPVVACDRNETSACLGRPIITCDNTDKAVIYLKHNNETGQAKLEGNCVELTGKGEELVKATDKFLLYWYNILI